MMLEPAWRVKVFQNRSLHQTKCYRTAEPVSFLMVLFYLPKKRKKIRTCRKTFGCIFYIHYYHYSSLFPTSQIFSDSYICLEEPSPYTAQKMKAQKYRSGWVCNGVVYLFLLQVLICISIHAPLTDTQQIQLSLFLYDTLKFFT